MVELVILMILDGYVDGWLIVLLLGFLLVTSWFLLIASGGKNDGRLTTSTKLTARQSLGTR
jgi:hypothetical protein